MSRARHDAKMWWQHQYLSEIDNALPEKVTLAHPVTTNSSESVLAYFNTPSHKTPSDMAIK